MILLHPSASVKKDTWKSYYFSKEEIDARKMERLTTQFIKYYDSFMKMEEQFKDLKLSKIC